MTACTSFRKDPPEVVARIRGSLSLVDMICHQLQRQLRIKTNIEELTSHGREGLLAAARSYDPSRGLTFRRWANIRVKGAVLDGIRASSMLPRSVYARLRAADDAGSDAGTGNPRSAARARRLDDGAERKVEEYLALVVSAIELGMAGGGTAGLGGEVVDGTPSAEQRLIRRELIDAVRDCVADLPAPERTLIERHYFDGVNFARAAAELGLSKSWASRLHARGVRLLIKRLRTRRVI